MIAHGDLDSSDQGFLSAFHSFSPLAERDFPTDELVNLFVEIRNKHAAIMEKAKNTIHLTNPPNHLYYSSIKGPSRKWFKKKFWQLFIQSMRHNSQN
jgi:hypothetical protein